MECPLEGGRARVEATEIFVAYSAGSLAPLEESNLERHMEGCSACRDMAAAQQQVWAALDAWTPASVDSNFDAKLYSRIAVDRQLPWWKHDWTPSRSWKPAMPVAAACAALLTAFLIRTPIVDHAPNAGVQPRIDMEQVERALDDIDMLKQIAVGTTSTPVKPIGSHKL
jgi:anti-sigma factor RsiW